MFEISKIHDVSILHLFGEINLLEIEYIQKLIESFKRCQHKKFLLDLANVDYVHFQAVRKWAAEAIALRTASGDLKIVNVKKQTKEAMQFTGADQYLEDYSNTADAILSFIKDPQAIENEIFSENFQDKKGRNPEVIH